MVPFPSKVIGLPQSIPYRQPGQSQNLYGGSWCSFATAKPIAWIPVDDAARAILEMRFSSNLFLHLAHSRPIPWSFLARSLSDRLHIPLVPYSDWLMLLEKSSNEAEVSIAFNPALRIVDFFRTASMEETGNTEAMGLPRLGLEEALKASKTLGDLNFRQIGTSDIDLWIAYWKSTGFM